MQSFSPRHQKNELRRTYPVFLLGRHLIHLAHGLAFFFALSLLFLLLHMRIDDVHNVNLVEPIQSNFLRRTINKIIGLREGLAIIYIYYMKQSDFFTDYTRKSVFFAH